MFDFSKPFWASNETKWRFARTLVQAILGVVVDYVVVVVAKVPVPAEFRPAIVTLVMSILSPIMSELSKRTGIENTNDSL